MGLFDRLRSRTTSRGSTQPSPAEKKSKVVVGAESPERDILAPYYNGNITFNGSLSGYNYNSILRDKQGHITDLYKIADYYVDADPVIHGIVKHVYLPYTFSSPWVLHCESEKTKAIYEEYYKKIRLREKLEGIGLEYWKYSNVYVYIMNGVPITLPPDKCKIGNVAFNGEPLVDFNCGEILNEWKTKGYTIKENWVKDNDIETYFKGYPVEVQEAINKGEQYAQLNPKYTKVLQGPKEGWHRYSIPFIAACLMALARKELISEYEATTLDLGIHSFVHVRYGDEKKGADMLPDIEQLRGARSVFSQAMNGFPLAVTNQLAKADVVQPKLDDLFQWDKYRDVNNDILSAGGISGILVSGVSEDGSTFASAQVSMQTAAARIEAAREEICELMNKINVCIQEELASRRLYNVKKVPEFKFMPLDMAGKKALREACKELWLQGVVSTKSMMEQYGYSIDREAEQRKREAEDFDNVLIPRDRMQTTAEDTAEPESTDDGEDNRGRPEMTDEERNSDPDAAMRGKQPKPSSPEGSMGDSEIG